jgi:hypothetical protein
MSYDRKHVLMTWGGDLPGGEKWSCGIRLASALSEAELSPIPLSISDDFLEVLVDSYANAVLSYHSDPNTGIHYFATVTWVKASGIGTDGKYLRANGAVATRATVVTHGGVSTGQMPNQNALAVTLTTAFRRGPAHEGRFFLPMPARPVQPDGLLAQDAVQLIATATKGFIESISDIPGLDLPTSPGAAVMSKVGSGHTNRVTGVSVGRAVDTQRRRRLSLNERYESTTVDQGTN